MAGVALADPRKQYLDSSGNPLAGGFVYTYLAGTTDATTTWQDRAKTTENTNPVVLDAAGSCLIVLDSLLTYKIVVTNSAGVTQSHLGGDNIVGAAGVQYLTDAIAAIEAQETTSVAAVAAAQTTATDAVDALVTQAEGILSDTEAARDTAFTNADVYDDTTAGLAAVASGVQFQVISGDESIRYLDNAGSAVEKVRFPTSTAMRLTALTAGMKKYRSLIPLDCLADSAYGNADRTTLAVRVQDTDLIYKSLGVKHEMPGNNFDSHRVRVHEPVASLDNKWVTVGYIARDAGATFHTNALVARTADNKASTTNAANHTPTAANRRTIQLDTTHRLYYAQVQLGTSLDGKYLFLDEVTLTDPTDYIAAPFIFVTDSQPTLSELDIFPGERGQFAQDYADATTTDPLLDEIGATLVSDHSTTLSNGATTATVTDTEVVNTLPSGSVIELPYSATLAATGTFILPSVASLQNKFVHCSVFAYSADGNFTGFGVTPFLRNVASNTAITALDDTVRITHISASLRRYDFIGEFRDVWTSYGAAMRGARTAASGTTNSIYLFGFMAAVKDEPFVSQYMQPIAWVPKNEVVTGRQMENFVPAETTPWTGKKIVWMGTSIPDGGGYPEAVASALGAASVENIALSGGSIRAFQSDNSWFTQANLVYKFTLEAADITTRYGANLGQEVNSSDYLTLQPGSGFTLTQAHLDALVAQNWVARLEPHIADGDLFVFDYGINDAGGQLAWPFESPSTAGYDRRYFAGAMAYIYKQIRDTREALGLNTCAVVITHHSRVSGVQNSTYVVDSQREIGEYWGLPVIDLAANCGLNTLTLTDLIPDTLHFSSGDAIELRVRHLITEELKKVYP